MGQVPPPPPPDPDRVPQLRPIPSIGMVDYGYLPWWVYWAAAVLIAALIVAIVIFSQSGLVQ